MDKCIFCDTTNKNILFHSELCYAIYDEYPVSKGHVLIIPYKHISDYRELDETTKKHMWTAVDHAIYGLTELFNPDGFNIGINIGESAGQSIPHVHIHVIPRYNGDVETPRGGVRGVIPNKQNY